MRLYERYQMKYELFSQREQARLKAGQEDVFQYDVLPRAFRVQIDHLLNEAVGPWNYQVNTEVNKIWTNIFNKFTREKGVYSLSPARDPNLQQQCSSYLLHADPLDVLDFIELSFSFVILHLLDPPQYFHLGRSLPNVEDFIDELNHRFRQHAIGYEFSGFRMIRIDSKFLHSEAVKPAIQLMHGVGAAFEGPLQEFMEAHRKYREGEHKDAVLGAAKAFESVLKSICTERGWAFDAHKDTAGKLVKIVLQNGLVPSYLDMQFGSMQSLLDSGVATIRNKTSGHGQGPTPIDVPEHLVSYALHLTASCIVYLLESHKALH